jgi:hypothetical protein
VILKAEVVGQPLGAACVPIINPPSVQITKRTESRPSKPINPD